LGGGENPAMTAAGNGAARPRVLFREDIGGPGVELLRAHFDVALGFDWDEQRLAERIGEFQGIVIRSATKMTSELIERAHGLRVIGRAGVGVDNVDVEAATRRGIVVANAPQSNVVTAAEHTMALLLALARNVPQAHMSLVGGKWERSKFSGIELYEKTLGILGFGRIGQLVAHRARAFGMRVLAFDPFVSTERYREQSAEQVVAALSGGVVSTAVNIPSIEAEDMEVLGPFLPLAAQLGRLAMALAEGSSVERIEAAFLGRIADFDTRLLTLAVIQGALQGRTEEEVNLVNAPSMADERGIVVEEKVVSEAQDFHELIRVTVTAGSLRVAVAGTGIGPGRVPHLVEVQGRRLTVELERFVTVFRYADLPGMIGRVGTIFGRHGINISSAAVGHTPDGGGPGAGSDGEEQAEGQRLAAMVVTTD